MTRNEKQKIIAAGAIGAFAGFIVGITLLDSGWLGAILVGGPAAYFMNLRIGRENPGGRGDSDVVTLSEGADGKFTADVSPLDDICKAGRDAVPVMERFLTGCWNLLMKGIVAAGVMGVFRKYPWLFAVLIVLMLALVLPVGLVLAFAGLSALNARVRAEDDFMVRAAGCAVPPTEPDEPGRSGDEDDMDDMDDAEDAEDTAPPVAD